MSRLNKALVAISKSVWFFPGILFIIVLALSAVQLNGSSMGIYHQFFYGETTADKDLVFNKPRAIRSDEWLVSTQLSLAQTRDNFKATNLNIGDGADLSLLVDAPTSDFSQVFKPHNLGYFVLDKGVAFSLKWWLLAYLMIVSVYFLIITLTPKRKMLAIIVSLGFAASPFISWWYQYITLAPLYYALFITTVSIKIIHTKQLKHTLLWSLLLAYLAVSFVLVLYPPFQIACGLVVFAFLLGYYLDRRLKGWSANRLLLIGFGTALVVTVILLTSILMPKLSIIDTVAHTAYPGNRITLSGSFNATFFLSSNASLLSQSNSRAGSYGWLPNQSEGSNFLLIFLLLIPVLIYFVTKYRRKLSNFYSIICILAVSMLYLMWLFVPGLEFLGKITLLDRVPQLRLLIGFGLINLFCFILTIQALDKKYLSLPKYLPIAYSLCILSLYLFVDFTISMNFPGFMGTKLAFILSLPYAIIIYLTLKRRMIIAAVAFLIFSVGSIIFIHPLYRGVDTLVHSKVSDTIRSVDPSSSRKWVTDSIYLENLPALNGRPSLSGVYIYPQNKLWQGSFPVSDKEKYNRYAHVQFSFDRDPNIVISRSIAQPSPDQMIPTMEPCDSFMKSNNVGYILTTTPFIKEAAPCATLSQYLSFPQNSLYIYALKFS